MNVKDRTLTRRQAVVAGGCATAMFAIGPARAQGVGDRLKVVATFSILADLIGNVGASRIDGAMLVGPNGNAHVYAPSPADARKVAEARLVFVNGLGFEGWLDRLVKASASRASIVVVSKGIKPREREGGGDRDHDRDHGQADPHAWQSVANVKIYARNICDALVAADPGAKDRYETNTAAYVGKLDTLDREVRQTIARIPLDRRRVITSHKAFGYFQDAYGIEFSAPQGVSTEAEVSARDVAALIRQIKAQKIAAIFLENITDSRLMEQIAKETGAKVGGMLYSDALTEASGDAPTYIDLIRHNLKQLAGALLS